MLPPPEALRLANSLRDIPRWIETRAMLLSGRAQVTGGATVEQGFVVKQCPGVTSAVAVVGRPPREAIVGALEDIAPPSPVLAQVEDAAWVQDALATVSNAATPWRGETFIVHALADPGRSVAVVGEPVVRMLQMDDGLGHLPPGLLHEMTHARLMGPVAVVFDDGVAASFCYPCWQTEGLWDVSIDTLDEHRGQSFAVAAVRLMIDHMRRAGRLPVWGAADSNRASLRLAARIGFVAVDRIVVFSRGDSRRF
jgi:GNAT superfamily N-acetyltransferase